MRGARFLSVKPVPLDLNSKPFHTLSQAFSKKKFVFIMDRLATAFPWQSR
jgi:hypothetical protein